MATIVSANQILTALNVVFLIPATIIGICGIIVVLRLLGTMLNKVQS